MYVFISQQKKKDKTKQNKTKQKTKKRPKNMRDRGIERQKDITS